MTGHGRKTGPGVPKVSVVVTCHDLGRYLDEAVDSILAQTMKDVEIIVVDDASSDPETLELLTRFERPRTRLMRVEKEHTAAARNCGIREARGGYICCLDADDVLEPVYLEKACAVLDAQPGTGFVGCWYEIFGEEDGHFQPTDYSASSFLAENPAPVPSLFRREAWKRVGGYDEKIAGHEDWELWIDFLAHGYGFRMIEEELFRYRTRRGSKISRSKRPEARAAFMEYIIQKHRAFFERHALDVVREKDRLLSEMVEYLGKMKKARDWFVLRGEEHERYIARLDNRVNELAKELRGAGRELRDLQEENGRRRDEIEQLNRAMRIKEHELRSITSSKAWKLGTAFDRAKRSPKDLLLLPFRVVDLAIPDSVKRGLKKILLIGPDEPIKKNFFKFPFRLAAALTPRCLRERIPFGLRNMARRAFGRGNELLFRQEPWDGPLVSVVIPCYNYGQYIDEALRSVLEQSFTDLEVIVIDDGSTERLTIDKLDEIEVRSLPRVKVIRSKNAGVSAARNRAIAEARGKYICCLDADDKLDPTYLEKMLLMLESRNLDLCYSHVRLFGDESWVWATCDFSPRTIMRENCVCTAAVFTKAIWEKAGGFNVNMDHGWEDWDFWVSVAGAGGRGAVLPEPLFLYRRHGETRDVKAAEEHSEYLLKKIRGNHRDLYEGRVTLPPIRSYDVRDPFVNLRRGGDGRGEKEGKSDILFLLPWMVVGGADFLLRGIAETLSRGGGTRIHIITTDRPLPSMGDSMPEFLEITPDIYRLPDLLDERHWYPYIESYIRRRKIDTVFICGSRFIYPHLAALKKSLPGLKIADQLFNDSPMGHVGNNRRYAESIDLTFTAAEKIRRSILDRHGGDPDGMLTIYHGVDTRKFDQERFVEAKARDLFGIPPGKKVVLYVGRLSEEKNPGLFIDCAEAFRGEDEYLFVVRGNGPLLDEIRDRVARRGLKNIHFIGIVPEEDIPAVYSPANLLVLPSRTEGIPLTLFEALAMNVPVVATDVGGISDVIEEGVNGFLCREGDRDGLIRAVRKALKTPFGDLRGLMEERHEIKEVYTRYVEALEGLHGNSL